MCFEVAIPSLKHFLLLRKDSFMSNHEDGRSYLRLLPPLPSIVAPKKKASITEQTQLELFTSSEVLGLLLFTSSTIRRFIELISHTRPTYIFDVRPLPVFDAVGTSRRRVFNKMEELGVTYVDTLGALGVLERRHTFIHSELVQYVHSVCGEVLKGPLLFLFDSEDDLAVSSAMLPNSLKTSASNRWIVRGFPDLLPAP
jgi:hypothetical protein